MKEYHPDRVSGLDKELQETAKKKAIEINLAYEYLGKTMGFN
jgi:DnaJ-domain-containing protein 1